MTRLPDEEPVDITTLTEDDRLLDQLGRGESVPEAERVATMLAGWRASLPESDPADERRLAATLATRPRGLVRVWLAVAAGVVLICGGVTVAAEHAGPGSPLWPITRLVYGDEAESRQAVDAAGQAIADARVAIGQGRFADASRLLDEAAALLPAIREPEEAQRLQSELDAARALIPSGPSGPVTTEPNLTGLPSISPTEPTLAPAKPPAAGSPTAIVPRPVEPEPSGAPSAQTTVPPLPVPALPVPVVPSNMSIHLNGLIG